MRRTLSIAVVAFVLAGACGQRQQQAPPAASSPSPSVVAARTSPEQLGEIGAAIRKEPAKADSILAAHGLDEKSFEAAIRKLSEDPAGSRRYAAAFKKAS